MPYTMAMTTNRTEQVVTYVTPEIHKWLEMQIKSRSGVPSMSDIVFEIIIKAKEAC